MPEPSVKHLSREFQSFLLPLGLMVVIFLLSSIPGTINENGLKFLSEMDPHLQNLLHIPLFGLLQWLWLRAMIRTGRTGYRVVFICFGLSMGYAIFDEFHQMFVPGRYASFIDMVLNLVGVLGATLLFGYGQRWKFTPVGPVDNIETGA